MTRKDVSTRAERMRKEKEMRTARLTIKRGLSNRAIYNLAWDTRPHLATAFYFSNRIARNTIRHCLTNYEAQYTRISPDTTGIGAYNTLRCRIDQIVDEAYPQFAEGRPEVRLGRIQKRGSNKKKPSPAPPPPVPVNTAMAAALAAAGINLAPKSDKARGAA